MRFSCSLALPTHQHGTVSEVKMTALRLVFDYQSLVADRKANTVAAPRVSNSRLISGQDFDSHVYGPSYAFCL